MEDYNEIKEGAETPQTETRTNHMRSFADLGVQPDLLRAITEMGFENPMHSDCPCSSASMPRATYPRPW